MKSRLPPAVANKRNAISNSDVPACDMMRNRTPARRASPFSCSKLTRQYADSAITSQATRKKKALAAVNTSVRLRSRML